jgi:hypothetical protein
LIPRNYQRRTRLNWRSTIWLAVWIAYAAGLAWAATNIISAIVAR